VKLTVFDILGSEAALLVNDELRAGSYRFDLDASNLSSGIYFYNIRAENYNETKRMILVK
jgi:hypothetical protein